MWEASGSLLVIAGLILIFAIISFPPRARKARPRPNDSPEIAGLNAGIPTLNVPDNVAQKGVLGGAVLDDFSGQHVNGDSGMGALGCNNDLLASISPEYDKLLDKAVARRGTPEDVEEWAKQLAGDIADLTD
jgi:hypothetical protein